MLQRPTKKLTPEARKKLGAQKRKEPELTVTENSITSITADKIPAAYTFFSPPKRSRTALAVKKHGESPSKFNPSYPRLTHSFAIQSDSVFICDGAGRESILVDMNSAALQTYFTTFAADLEANEALTQSQHDSDDETTEKPKNFFMDTQPSDFLRQVAEFVSQTFSGKVSEEIIAKIVSDYKETLKADVRDKIDYIPLEIFINHKMGYCRHHALLVSCLLVKLNEHIAQINERPAASTNVYRYRNVLLSEQLNSSHAVVVYEDDKGQRFFIDSTRKLGKELGVASLISPDSEMDKAMLKELESRYTPFDLVEFIASLNARYDALRASLIASSSSSSSYPTRLTF